MSFVEPRCTICNDNRRKEFDELLLKGEKTQKQLSKEFGFTENMVSLHKNKHVLPNSRLDLLEQILDAALLRGVEPQNLGDLMRCLEAVERMKKEGLETAIKEFKEKAEEKINSFSLILNQGELFSDIPDKSVIVNLLRSVFLSEHKDAGTFVKLYLEENEKPKIE